MSSDIATGIERAAAQFATFAEEIATQMAFGGIGGGQSVPTHSLLFRHTAGGTLFWTATDDFHILSAHPISSVSSNWCLSFDGTSASNAALTDRVLPPGIIAIPDGLFGAFVPVQKGQIIYSSAAAATWITVCLQITAVR